MAEASSSFMDRLIASLRRLMSGDAATEAPADAVPFAAAILLAEMARVDHDVKDVDLAAAREGLQRLFALTAQQARALIERAGHAENRPTSYHSIVSLLNDNLSPQQKIQLVEHMWRVAQVDREIDMYEDHLVRKIADLLYVPHREFIAAKHRAGREAT